MHRLARDKIDVSIPGRVHARVFRLFSAVCTGREFIAKVCACRYPCSVFDSEKVNKTQSGLTKWDGFDCNYGETIRRICGKYPRLRF